jgi:hypothetical protein
MSSLDTGRIRLEGELEVLEGACRNAELSLRKLRAGEAVNLCDSLHCLTCRDTREAERKASRLLAPTPPVVETLERLHALREALPALVRRRAATLLLPDDGNTESLARHLVADPIRFATSLEDLSTQAGTPWRAAVGCGIVAATLLTVITSGSCAVLSAVLAVFAGAVFVEMLGGEPPPEPVILTRSRLIVGRRDHALAEMHSFTVYVGFITTLEILDANQRRITFLKSPPPWLETALRARGLPCRERWLTT